MKVYVGQTRSRALIAELVALGIGEITQRHEVPPRRTPWALDNGAFGDWRAQRPFDAAQFRNAIARARALSRPDFVVVPDLVAQGRDSLALSLKWRDECADVAPPYLVVQDGMTDDDVAEVIERFDGLFVGGTLPWKLSTGAAWVRLAHAHGRRCHVGRVGTAKRVAWAKRINADSIDSSLPLWSRSKMTGFVAAIRSSQTELFGGN